MPRLLLAFLLCLMSAPLWALPSAVLDRNDVRLPLGPQMGYLRDDGGKLKS